MTRAYNAIDADGHILEPLDLWDKYIDPEFRERRPRFVIDDNGKERLSVEGKLLGNPRGIGSLGSVGARQGIVKPGTLKYAEARKGGFDPHARIVDMDADGIDAVLADYIGPHKTMWATDYPHSDGFFPGAPQMLRERLGRLSPEAKHQVLAGGALGFYGLS